MGQELPGVRYVLIVANSSDVLNGDAFGKRDALLGPSVGKHWGGNGFIGQEDSRPRALLRLGGLASHDDCGQRGRVVCLQVPFGLLHLDLCTGDQTFSAAFVDKGATTCTRVGVFAGERLHALAADDGTHNRDGTESVPVQTLLVLLLLFRVFLLLLNFIFLFFLFLALFTAGHFVLDVAERTTDFGSALYFKIFLGALWQEIKVLFCYTPSEIRAGAVEGPCTVQPRMADCH